MSTTRNTGATDKRTGLNATETINEAHRVAYDAMQRISKAMADETTGTHDQHWGHAGTAQEMAHQLKQVADMLTGEGEWAE